MFRQQRSVPRANSLICPECGSTRFRYYGSKVECADCGWKHSAGTNKFGAKRTEFNGKKYDSKWEANIAQELELRKAGKDILDYDTQYLIVACAYRQDGTKAFEVKHKVDFRLHLNDGSYELLEAKGVETPDYLWRRKFLEHIWLPEHPDHTYTVVKQKSYRR